MTRDLCITHQSLQDSLVRRVENPVSLSRDDPCPLSDRPIQYRTITTKMWKERAWRGMGAIEQLSCRPALIKFLPLSTLERSARCQRENARRKHEQKIWKKKKLRKLKRTSHAYSMGFEVTNQLVVGSVQPVKLCIVGNSSNKRFWNTASFNHRVYWLA
jgi:hypothetical protein